MKWHAVQATPVWQITCKFSFWLQWQQDDALRVIGSYLSGRLYEIWVGMISSSLLSMCVARTFKSLKWAKLKHMPLPGYLESSSHCTIHTFQKNQQNPTKIWFLRCPTEELTCVLNNVATFLLQLWFSAFNTIMNWRHQSDNYTYLFTKKFNWFISAVLKVQHIYIYLHFFLFIHKPSERNAPPESKESS